MSAAELPAASTSTSGPVYVEDERLTRLDAQLAEAHESAATPLDDEETFQRDVAARVARGEHRTQYAYTLWFNRRVQGARTQENYERSIKRIASFGTVERFWDIYNHLIRPNELPNTCDYHLFKRGVKPMWEDETNRAGGKWIVRLRKGICSRYFEDLLLAIIGEQFNVGDEVCGCVVSIRYQEDIISVWNKTSDAREAKLRIHDTMRRVLQLPSNTIMEYKCHDASIKDNSSFRNTESHGRTPQQDRRQGGRPYIPGERRRLDKSTEYRAPKQDEDTTFANDHPASPPPHSAPLDPSVAADEM